MERANSSSRWKGILVVGILLFALYKAAEMFAPGSYPFAEYYDVEVTEDELIRATQKFKMEHPEFVPPDSIGLTDGRRDLPNEYWYHIYFYYPNENQLLNTWIRSSGKTRTTFAFVAINEGTQLGNWKEINNDFDGDENRLKKRQFEERILNRIKENLK